MSGSALGDGSDAGGSAAPPVGVIPGHVYTQGLNVARLLDKQGDAKLAGQMPTLANRDKARAFSLYDRCKARYGLCP